MLNFPLSSSLLFFSHTLLRIISSSIMAASLFLFFCPLFIAFAKKHFKSKTREYAPLHHQQKNATPTMGGCAILAVTLVTILLFNNLQPSTLVLILILSSFGALGAWDDYCKINYHKGIPTKTKFIWQLALAFLALTLWLLSAQPSMIISIPIVNITIYLNFICYLAWGMLVLLATSNAVNLTDGLDGLAASSLSINFFTYTLLSIIMNTQLELAVTTAILFGTCIGFLWFNLYPAKLFMGDVGSLSLGAALGFIALANNLELGLIISGIIFVTETVTVILQISSYKINKKKPFLMAPLHHHFELLGWKEKRIVRQFTIITLVSCLFLLISIAIIHWLSPFTY